MIACDSMACCGWSEIFDLSGYKGAFEIYIKALIYSVSAPISEDGRSNQGAILFTANTANPNYADHFAKDIRVNKLGRVISLPKFSNPNTGNRITTYAWIVNQKNLERYIKRHKLIKAYWE